MGRSATMIVVTQVAPYGEAAPAGPGPAGVHRVLGQAATALGELSQMAGLEPRTVDDVRAIEAVALGEARLLALFTIGETPFSAAQRAAVLSAWHNGTLGILGVHSATDACHGWPEYGRMLGARFDGHPWTQPFEIEVTDSEHPATARLGPHWSWRDEVYLFRDLRPEARVLLRLDPGGLDLSVPGARVPDGGLPLAWCHEEGRGRTFYSALGHFPEAWERPDHLRFLEGGMRWLLQGSPARATPAG